MPLAWTRDEYECPRCGAGDPVGFDKDEGSRIKVCLTCVECDREFTEWEDRT